MHEEYAMKRPSTALLALVVLLLTGQVHAQQRTAIAFVSIQRILNEFAGAKSAARQIEDLRKAKMEDVQAKQKALEATRLEIANAGGLFSGSRRTDLHEKEKRQQAELQQASQQAQNEVQKLQADLQAQLRKDVSAVLESLARARGVQLVLNTDTAVVWAATGVDLTGDVLKALDAKSGTPK
jgi:Skp family chaperone for outer membrane proteins